MTMGISPTRPTSHEPPQPDPEVLERPQRRRFTAEYRTSILRQADACTHKGELGALLPVRPTSPSPWPCEVVLCECLDHR